MPAPAFVRQQILLGGAFSPLQLPGLARWLDASDLSTLFQDSARTTPVTADADPAGGVTDKSGQRNHFIQATAGKRPTFKAALQNGRSALRFDGVDDQLDSLAAAYPVRTTFLVAKRAVTIGGAFFAYSNVGARLLDGTTEWQYFTNEAAGAQSLVGGSPASLAIVTLQFASTASCVARVNGVQTASFDPSDGYSTGATLTLGARPDGAAPGNHDIFELIDCSGVLSASNISLTERYLATRYGVAI